MLLCVLLLFLTLNMYEGRISTPAFHYYLLRETKDQTKSKSFLKNLKAKSLLIFTSNPKQFDVSRLCFGWSIWRYHHFHFSYKIYAVSETLSTLTQPSNTSLNMLFQTCFSSLETIPQLLQFELQFCKIRPVVWRPQSVPPTCKALNTTSVSLVSQCLMQFYFLVRLISYNSSLVQINFCVSVYVSWTPHVHTHALLDLL